MVSRTGEIGINWCRFRKSKGIRMKQIAVLTLLVALGAGWSAPINAQDAGVSKSDLQADKSAQKQQKALYEYQKKQEKAREQAQRKADKQQQKAAKKYEKDQRKLLKNTNLPSKHTS
jgi:hypothetical protein